MKASQLRQSIVSTSSGEASHVVDAVYENSSQQIVAFVGGNITGSSPSSFINSFIGRLPDAVTTSAGPLGGEAACVPSVAGRPAECAWADNDTFGLVLSPTLDASALAQEMRQIRPQVEHLVTK
jgi:thiamine monophosphate kinase